MSLFRKPKKIVARRVFSYDDEHENDAKSDNKMDVDPPDTKSADRDKDKDRKKDKDKKSSKSTEKKSSSSSSNTKFSLLSFDDEAEEDAEIFQVKKSSHSKKVMKMLDKKRRKKDKEERNGTTTKDDVKISVPTTKEKESNNDSDKLKKEKSESSNLIHTEIRTDDFVLVVKNSDPENIILNGRAALCAGKDDMTSEEEENDEEESNHRFSKPEHFKMYLESGVIPDAAMIHAARKRRQKAREQGDFIPIEEPKKEEKSKRLVAEGDEGDGSDEEEERIDMSNITGAKELAERREQFYSVQQEDSAEDSDMETKEWENQQIRKGVTGAQLVSAQQESIFSQYMIQSYSHQQYKMNQEEEIMSTGALLEQAYAKSSGGLSTKLTKSSKTSAKIDKTTGPRMPMEILKQIKDKMTTTRELNYKHINDIERLTNDVAKMKLDYEEATERAPAAAIRYRFYQEIRCYVVDLIECLDEKMPQIIALEQKSLAVMGKYSQTLIERRRQDVRDQAKEMADAAKNVKKGPEDVERVRRAAEREGRRTRRRRTREKNNFNESHYDGMSSDDEVADNDALQYKNQFYHIQIETAMLMEDVSEEFSQCTDILDKFQSWRDGEMDSYREAYVSLCLPKILGPLIRLKYVNWNPLEDSSYDFEKEDWFKACVMYGKAGDNEKAISEDIDIRLIPTLIEKIFLPKITMLIEQYWDPMSTTQTLKLVRLISRLTRDYPSIRPTCRQLRTLFQMLLDKIKTAIDNDMFIPVFPKQITESKGSFFQRQFCGGLKLFRNILSWQGIVADTALRDLAINSLLNRYLLSAMRVCSPMDAATKASMIVYTLPRVWLNNSTEILPNMEMFIVLLKNIQLQLDKKNQVHLESMEKIDNILTSLHVAM